MDAKNCRNLFDFQYVDSMRMLAESENIAFMTFSKRSELIYKVAVLFDIDYLKFRMPMIKWYQLIA